MKSERTEAKWSLPTSLKEIVLDSGQYWELMRIPYNVILAGLSLVCWGSDMLSDGIGGVIAGVVVLTFFAIGANLLYCAAYPVDIAFQLTPLRRYRAYPRWLMFVSGTILATALACYVLLGDHMA
jgi:hypothetical protein